MYKLVIKVPEMVFFIFIFLPILLIVGGYYPDPFSGMLLSMLGLITGVFWMIGISAYFDKVLENKNIDFLLYAFVALFFVAALRDIYHEFLNHFMFFHSKSTFPIFTIIFACIVGIILGLKVKKVLFNRSLWFTILEIAVYPFGIATLTPEIKNHYKENRKKMDKIFAGENEEELLS